MQLVLDHPGLHETMSQKKATKIKVYQTELDKIGLSGDHITTLCLSVYKSLISGAIGIFTYSFHCTP